jgi:hypothetical protein
MKKNKVSVDYVVLYQNGASKESLCIEKNGELVTLPGYQARLISINQQPSAATSWLITLSVSRIGDKVDY